MIVLQKMKSLFDAPTTAVDPKEKTNETRLMNNAARFIVSLNKVLLLYGSIWYNVCTCGAAFPCHLVYNKTPTCTVDRMMLLLPLK